MTTESQDLGLKSHPKDGAFDSIVSIHYLFIFLSFSFFLSFFISCLIVYKKY